MCGWGDAAGALSSRGRKSITRLLSPEDFNDAIGVNKHRLFLTEIDDDVIILRRSNISGFCERVLRAVVEADTKGTERLPCQQTFDFLAFHAGKVVSGEESSNHEIVAIAAALPNGTSGELDGSEHQRKDSKTPRRKNASEDIPK